MPEAHKAKSRYLTSLKMDPVDKKKKKKLPKRGRNSRPSRTDTFLARQCKYSFNFGEEHTCLINFVLYSGQGMARNASVAC